MGHQTDTLLREIDRKWESLTFANDFVFGKVMLDEDLCRKVLETILVVPIDRIEYIAREEAVDVAPDAKA